MTTATLRPRTVEPGAPGAHGAWRTLVRTETRIFLRDPAGVFFGLVFPTVLLVGIGFAIPGMRDVMTDVPEPWAGLRAVDVYVPVALAAALATSALTTLPVNLATYREQGIFRRLQTTPLRPRSVLTTHVLINLVALMAAVVLALMAAAVIFGTGAPANLGVAALALGLGAAAMFGVGLLVAARVRKGSTASGIGMLIYFPMLFFAGMWTPGPVMPDAVAAVAVWTPLGAATQAMTHAWFDGGFPAAQLLALALWVAVLYPLAARLFRWS